MNQQAHIHALEGRLIAHRKLMARLLALLSDTDRKQIDDWLDKTSVPHDGQEDPGIMPSDADALELALADELRLIRDRLAAATQYPDAEI